MPTAQAHKHTRTAHKHTRTAQDKTSTSTQDKTSTSTQEQHKTSTQAQEQHKNSTRQAQAQEQHTRQFRRPPLDISSTALDKSVEVLPAFFFPMVYMTPISLEIYYRYSKRKLSAQAVIYLGNPLYTALNLST